MDKKLYIYQDRLVAFIDVLGFQQMLVDFEKDAVHKQIAESEELILNENESEPLENNEDTETESSAPTEAENTAPDTSGVLISQKVNDFINTVKDVLSLLDANNFQYYLFSDNICITVDYVSKPELLVELLYTLNDLFYEFAKRGYFLRGGIDAGKFVDETKVALGLPLANAYLLESKDAVYPRILLSERYLQLLRGYLISSGMEDLVDKELLIKRSCEFSYLNNFYRVVKTENPVQFFSDYKTQIENQLQSNAQKEKVYIKYEWLADSYNNFLDEFSNSLVFQSEEEPDPQLQSELSLLKI